MEDGRLIQNNLVIYMIEQSCYSSNITTNEVICMMEELAKVPWAVIAPLIVVQIILMIVALVDLRKIHATNGPKILWVFLIIFTNIVGTIAYFIVGRKQ